jgi:hypothetical protein
MYLANIEASSPSNPRVIKKARKDISAPIPEEITHDSVIRRADEKVEMDKLACQFSFLDYMTHF